MGVPDEQIALPSEFSHRSAITVNRTEHDLAALFSGVGVIPTGNLETGGETLDIPFERSRMGSSKSFRSKNQLPLWRGKHSEIAEMSVAT